MRRNRLVLLAALALLVVGALGTLGARTFAQTPTTAPAIQETCGPDMDKIREGSQGGADTADKNQANCGEESDNGQASARAGTPTITAETARKAAEAYLNAGTATEVELEDENGQLVYSVEIGGTDVTVDAMNGQVSKTE